MNAYTGAIAPLDSQLVSRVEIGQPITSEILRITPESATGEKDFREAIADMVDRGEPVVAVGPHVAQQIKLGRRELERRARRRNAPRPGR